MRPRLLYPDADGSLEVTAVRGGLTANGPDPPSHAASTVQDLELDTMFVAMAHGDRLLYEIARHCVLELVTEPEQIRYRQDMLTDCLAHPELARELYAISAEAINGERHIYRPWGKQPSGALHWGIEVLELFTSSLRRLRKLADDHASQVSSQAMSRFMAMVVEELDDDYFERIGQELARLRFRHGLLLSARLGDGCRGDSYVLRSPSNAGRGWRERLGLDPRGSLSFEIDARDEAGTRALSELQDRGLDLVSHAVARSADHLLGFFGLLCAEIGFYVGALNLHDVLTANGVQTSTPEVASQRRVALSCEGLVDVSLALRSSGKVVSNSLRADGRWLIIITGANSGGKSTLLRSIGQAQLMAQCGMFVCARSYRLSVGTGLFTHFIREEDPTMRKGKLDEELARMSQTVDLLSPGALMLMNESFSSTNEREGSEIARQIVDALIEAGVRVIFVTHQFALAHSYAERRLDSVLFLRAERTADGKRTFRVTEGEPLPTSFGPDIYRRIGGFRDGAPATDDLI